MSSLNAILNAYGDDIVYEAWRFLWFLLVKYFGPENAYMMIRVTKRLELVNIVLTWMDHEQGHYLDLELW